MFPQTPCSDNCIWIHKIKIAAWKKILPSWRRIQRTGKKSITVGVGLVSLIYIELAPVSGNVLTENWTKSMESQFGKEIQMANKNILKMTQPQLHAWLKSEIKKQWWGIDSNFTCLIVIHFFLMIILQMSLCVTDTQVWWVHKNILGGQFWHTYQKFRTHLIDAAARFLEIYSLCCYTCQIGHSKYWRKMTEA